MSEAETTELKSNKNCYHQRQQSSNAVDYTTYFNVENAKTAAFILVSGFVIYHGFIHVKYGSDSCKWLLGDGRFQGYNSWQPYGCMMHKYTPRDSKNCMHYISYWGGKNHIVFLGDSRIRQLYYEFVNLFGTTPIEPEKKHSDLHYRGRKINLEVDFLWHPVVNDSMINVYKSWAQLNPKERPTLVVTGSATWSIKMNNGSMDALENYKANLQITAPHINELKNTTKVLWMLQDPVDEHKLGKNRSMITNSQVDKYNKAALEILEDESVTLWSSCRLVSQGYNKDSVDGLHSGKVALAWKIQILMNMHCNNNMNFNDGTCCSAAESVTVVQIITGTIFMLSALISIIMYCGRRRYKKKRSPSGAATSPSTPGTTNTEENSCDWFYDMVVQLTRLGVILCYFFICDRTYFFMKENKYYTHVNFFLPFAYLLILGFFFTENTENRQILHREQTDEWKGWMQLVILIYHLTGASRILQIYMQIRLLVTAYLFLSGFGHFTYFWNTGDYSLYRFCKVMYRMNFLVILLCFVMNRPYQFYYFVPLVSLWFCIIYLAMAIWPHITACTTDSNPLHYFYMVLKFVILVTGITLLYASEVLFEKIFLSHPIKSLFVTTDDSIREWRFRWQLDRYSTVYGMGFAFAVLVAKRFKVVDEDKADTLFSKGVSILSGLLALSGLFGYIIFTKFCKNKQECNEVHPYVAFVPIVSYIFLRNLPGWLRTKYSSFFAWFGKISLELFIAQYHIWLSADTHGVLVLVPGYQVLNFIITSFVFVCVAHEIHTLTLKLSMYLVPKDWKLLLRNFLCFASVLLPIAITHGVFGI